MTSKIGKKEWKGAFVVTGTIDVIQWVLDFFVVGLAINEVADPIIGVCLAAYFQFRGVSLISQPKRLASLLGSYLGEAFTDSIAPAWIIDVWYIYGTVKKEEAEHAAQLEQSAMMQGDVRQPLYRDGSRQPVEKDVEPAGPLNVDGIRPPGGGLPPAK
jgi:hypothetical protein